MSRLLQDSFVQFEAGLIVGVVLASVMLWRYFRKRQTERRKKNQEFIEILLQAFANEAASNVQDLVALHAAHFDSERSPVWVFRDLHAFMQAVQLRVARSHPVDGVPHKLIPRLTELRTLTDLVAKSLASEEKRVPFYGAPEPERGVLEDVLELTSADRTIVAEKLMRLAELIQTRHETIRALGEEKGQARKLAWWGLAGTVLFGVVSVILTFWTRTGTTP